MLDIDTLEKMCMEREKYSFSSSLFYSSMLCQKPSELVNIYIKSRKLRRFALQHIKRIISERGITNFIPLVEKMLKKMPELKGLERVSIRNILVEVSNDIPKNYTNKLFDILINGQLESDRQKAYEINNVTWTSKRINYLWNNWNKYREEGCIIRLSELKDKERIIKIIKRIWENEEITFKTKRKVLASLSKTHYYSLQFLRNIAPITYLFCSVVANKRLPQREIIKLAFQAKTQREFEYALWCIGKLNQRNALNYLFNNSSTFAQTIENKPAVLGYYLSND
jgi:hypothetical protein